LTRKKKKVQNNTGQPLVDPARIILAIHTTLVNESFLTQTCLGKYVGDHFCCVRHLNTIALLFQSSFEKERKKDEKEEEKVGKEKEREERL